MFLFLISLLVSQSAFAQDADPWSGLSVAVGAGVASIDAENDSLVTLDDAVDVNVPNPLPFGPASLFTLDADGNAESENKVSDDDAHFVGTGQVAFDQRFGNIVIGAFADYDFYPGNSAETCD